jgi:unsaturated rhamnogalacturonyl hydrolase
MKKKIIHIAMKSLILILVSAVISYSQSDQEKKSKPKIDPRKPWSVRIADSFILRHPADVINDTTFSNKWTYDQGVLLKGLQQLSEFSKDEKYFNYIKTNIDQFVTDEGKIKTYKYLDFNIDNINTGKELLYLYTKTKEQKYKTAADSLRKQLANHPRTKSKGFWHKKIYPYQMWLDGLYMGEPFYAEYSKIFNESQNYDDIIHQFVLIEKQTRDDKTGLLYHAWDERKQQRWSDPVTGRSPHFWSRAMGWYAMALVDVLDFIPEKHNGRNDLINILQRLCNSLLKFRDNKTGLWYQVTDLPDRKGNYIEASASCMFTYAFAKGANKNYLSKEFLVHAEKSFDGVIKNLVTIDEPEGFINLHNTCRGAGLGGNPYRDGSFEYYISEPKRTNDLKGLGPFINAAVELEKGKAL